MGPEHEQDDGIVGIGYTFSVAMEKEPIASDPNDAREIDNLILDLCYGKDSARARRGDATLRDAWKETPDFGNGNVTFRV